jgi:hypothetical protein
LLISITVSGTSSAFAGICGASSWGIGAITSFPRTSLTLRK